MTLDGDRYDEPVVFALSTETRNLFCWVGSLNVLTVHARVDLNTLCSSEASVPFCVWCFTETGLWV